MGRKSTFVRAGIFVLGGALVSGLFLGRTQAAPPQGAPDTAGPTPVMAENYFKNVQVLRGVPVDELQRALPAA